MIGRMTGQKRPPRRRINDPAAMRARILDAAADLFLRKGYHDTSVQEVMRAAGVTAGALHHHFVSKKQLGLSVVTDRIAESVREAWISPVEEARDTVSGVRTAFHLVADGLREQGFVRGCPANNLAVELAFADADFRAALQPIFEEWREAIARRLIDEGRDADEARDLATLVVAAYSGAMSMAKVEQTPEPLLIALRAVEGRLSLAG
jgi:AcrR family transcriptional regulator